MYASVCENWNGDPQNYFVTFTLCYKFTLYHLLILLITCRCHILKLSAAIQYSQTHFQKVQYYKLETLEIQRYSLNQRHYFPTLFSAQPIENAFQGLCLHPRVLISDMTRVCVYASALFSIQTVACSPCCAAQVRSKHLTFQAAGPCWPEVLPDVRRLWPVRPTPSPITSGLGPGPPPSGLTASPSDGCMRSRPSRWHTNTSPPQHHIWSLLQRRQSEWAWGGRVWTSMCVEYIYDKVEMFGVWACVHLLTSHDLFRFVNHRFPFLSFFLCSITNLPPSMSALWQLAKALRTCGHSQFINVSAWIGVCTKQKVTCPL